MRIDQFRCIYYWRDGVSRSRWATLAYKGNGVLYGSKRGYLGRMVDRKLNLRLKGVEETMLTFLAFSVMLAQIVSRAMRSNTDRRWRQI